MMYNHYIPESNGVYKRHSIEIPDCSPLGACNEAATPKQQYKEKRDPLIIPPAWDLGDWLVLCIVLLIIIEADDEDKLPLLISAAAFMLLQ